MADRQEYVVPVHRLRFELEMTAATERDLALQLEDMAHDLRVGKRRSRSVFASPSCSGILRIDPIAGLCQRCENEIEQGTVHDPDPNHMGYGACVIRHFPGGSVSTP